MCNHCFVCILFMILSFVFCCCSRTIYKTEVEYVFIKPSSSLLEECKPISTKDIKTNGDLLIAYHDLMLDYVICANRVVTLKQFYETYQNNNN